MKSKSTSFERSNRARLLARLRRGAPVFEIVGLWSRNGRVHHREYTSDGAFVDAVRKIGFITFCDQTTLNLIVKQVWDKDGIGMPLRGYDDLIRKAVQFGIGDVEKIVVLEMNGRTK